MISEKFSENGLSIFVNSIINAAIAEYNENLFITKTVEQLLFSGYKAPFMEKMLALASSMGYATRNAPADGMFGLMYQVSDYVIM